MEFLKKKAKSWANKTKGKKKSALKGRAAAGKARQPEGLTWGTMASVEFDLEGRMTHTYKNQKWSDG